MASCNCSFGYRNIAEQNRHGTSLWVSRARFGQGGYSVGFWTAIESVFRKSKNNPLSLPFSISLSNSLSLPLPQSLRWDVTSPSLDINLQLKKQKTNDNHIHRQTFTGHKLTKKDTESWHLTSTRHNNEEHVDTHKCWNCTQIFSPKRRKSNSLWNLHVIIPEFLLALTWLTSPVLVLFGQPYVYPVTAVHSIEINQGVFIKVEHCSFLTLSLIM